MLSLKDFIKKYNGKKVEYHSYISGALNQCVDVCNQYIVECLGLPAIIGTNAQDFPKKCGSNFKYIKNTPDGVPQEGDLVVWSSADNVGHIAIFVDGDANKFNSFDQNYPTNTACHIQSHTYLRPKVIGWMRALQTTTGTMEKTYTQEEWQMERDERNRNWDLLQSSLEINQLLKNELLEIRAEISGVTKSRDDLKTERQNFIDKVAAIIMSTADENNIIETTQRLISQESLLQAQIKQMEAESAKKQAELERENKGLKDELERLQNEFLEMEKKHQAEIEVFRKRLTNVQTQFEDNQEEVIKIDSWKTFVDAIIKIFKKG